MFWDPDCRFWCFKPLPEKDKCKAKHGFVGITQFFWWKLLDSLSFKKSHNNIFSIHNQIKPTARLQAQTLPDATTNTNRHHWPIQKNCRNSWTSNAIWCTLRLSISQKFLNTPVYDWKNHLQPFGRVGIVNIFLHRMSDSLN